jgi:hypothetical protein
MERSKIVRFCPPRMSRTTEQKSRPPQKPLANAHQKTDWIFFA